MNITAERDINFIGDSTELMHQRTHPNPDVVGPNHNREHTLPKPQMQKPNRKKPRRTPKTSSQKCMPLYHLNLLHRLRHQLVPPRRKYTSPIHTNVPKRAACTRPARSRTSRMRWGG